MTRSVASLVGMPLWTPRRATVVLLILHIPMLAVAPIIVVLGLDSADPGPASWGRVVSALIPAAGIAALQLRHSFAAARGARPRWWPATFAALVALVAVPELWLAWDWFFAWVFVAASALMLLPRIVGTLIAIGTILIDTGHGVLSVAPPAAISQLAEVAENIAYATLIFTLSIAALYGSTQLIRMIVELHDTRAALAELSVASERLRIARDLHDLLGQSLAAVSLKGDLATALLRRDPSAASAEITSITDTARTALRDVRAVATAPDPVDLTRELAGASALLEAAGTSVRVDVDLDDAGAGTREVLAWVVREGVTNIVRHSEASQVIITGHRAAGGIRLALGNDAARRAGPPGNGLDNLAARARAIGGSVHARRRRDGWFDLTVDIPDA
jgi:two-component system, NarL family, sensor histidine kinase DesK